MTQLWKVKHGLFVGSNGTKDEFLSPLIKKKYRAWRAIKTRCFDRNARSYKDYGARGITMCFQWQNDFMLFSREVGDPPTMEHSIGRINNDGHYEPGNVRWETSAQQMVNTRMAVRITIGDETRCIAEWARVVGISPTAFGRRIKVGRTGFDLLSPKRPGRRAR